MWFLSAVQYEVANLLNILRQWRHTNSMVDRSRGYRGGAQATRRHYGPFAPTASAKHFLRCFVLDNKAKATESGKRRVALPRGCAGHLLFGRARAAGLRCSPSPAIMDWHNQIERSERRELHRGGMLYVQIAFVFKESRGRIKCPGQKRKRKSKKKCRLTRKRADRKNASEAEAKVPSVRCPERNSTADRVRCRRCRRFDRLHRLHRLHRLRLRPSVDNGHTLDY
jgi:hypothetical protein